MEKQDPSPSSDMLSESAPAHDRLPERILGIPFFTGTVVEAVEQHRRNGGYVVIPAAPALIKLNYDEGYRRAMQKADMAIADSGLLVLLWRLATGRKLQNISGITYLKALLADRRLGESESSFWVMASPDARDKALGWLGGRGVRIEERDCYVAERTPSSSDDYKLLSQIEERRPADIVIAVAGGAQEKLALYLRECLLWRPRIHCVGAALDFLSGAERAIPEWAERTHLGWLSRLAAQPRMFFPRVGIALALARMVFKHRSEMPPLRQRWSDL